MISTKAVSRTLWIGVMSLMWMLFAAGAAMAGEATLYYRYFKEKRPLTVDSSRVAIRIAEGADSASLARTLNTSGIQVQALQPANVAQWFMAPAPAKSDTATAEGVGQLAAALKDGETETVDFVSPVIVGQNGAPIILTQDVLVGFRDANNPEINEVILSHYGEILERDWANMPGVYRLRAAAGDGLGALGAANDLAERDDTLFAEPDAIFTGRGEFIPNDPSFANQWALNNTGQKGGPGGYDLDCPQAWDVTFGNSQIGIAILDTGVQQDHPDINQYSGADVTSDGPGDGGPVNGYDNHGTLIAGIVTGIIDNNIGIAGIAPNCVSLSVRTFIGANNAAGWTSQTSWTVNALAWAEANGARITVNSNGYDPALMSSAINTKYAQTRANGMVHFGAAGDEFGNTIVYPANLDSVNSVAAMGLDGHLAAFSNYGAGLDFIAPGVLIYTTDRVGTDGLSPNDYDYFQGSSLAAAHAAGVAALILSQDPSLSAVDVEQRMRQTAWDLGDPGPDSMFGWGLVNANNPLRLSGIPTLTAPRIEPADGSYLSPISVSIQGMNEGVTIRYTTNGSEPRLTSSVYEGPFKLYGIPGKTFTVKAKAFKIGSLSSPVDTANYTVSTVSTGNLRMIEPNGGEQWGRASCQPIRWQHQSPNSTVQLLLYKGGAFQSIINNSTPGTGLYYWTVPTGLFLGNDYQIRVIDGGDTSRWDMSDANFSITDDPSSVHVEYPNGYEIIHRDSYQALRWTSDGASDHVKIDLYHNGYYSQTLAASAPNTGIYVWHVPTGISIAGDYRLRVSDVMQPTRYDFGDNVFFIAPPVISIAGNLDGKCMPVGSNNWIEWTAAELGKALEIQLLKDGDYYATIQTGAFNSGAFLWNIDESVEPGKGYAVRLVDAENPGVLDVSGEFEIGEPGGTDVNAAPEWMRYQ